MEAKVAEWAEIGVPLDDMATILGIPVLTLRERYADLIARHDAIGKAARQRAIDKRFPDGLPARRRKYRRGES